MDTSSLVRPRSVALKRLAEKAHPNSALAHWLAVHPEAHDLSDLPNFGADRTDSDARVNTGFPDDHSITATPYPRWDDPVDVNLAA